MNRASLSEGRAKMKCNCYDCTKCPHEYCIEEDKDNENSPEIKQREYFSEYYKKNRTKLNDYQRARYQWKIANGICVRCSEKATDGHYCARHKAMTHVRNHLEHLKRRGIV